MAIHLKCTYQHVYSPGDLGLAGCSLEAWAYTWPSGKVDKDSTHWLVRVPRCLAAPEGLRWFAEEQAAKRWLAQFARARREVAKLAVYH